MDNVTTYRMTNNRMLNHSHVCDLLVNDEVVLTEVSYDQAVSHVLINGKNMDTYIEDDIGTPQTVVQLRAQYNRNERFYSTYPSYRPHYFDLTREVDPELDEELIASLQR